MTETRRTLTGDLVPGNLSFPPLSEYQSIPEAGTEQARRRLLLGSGSRKSINLFGMRPRTLPVRRFEPAVAGDGTDVTCSAIVWTVCFGWWMAFLFFIAAMLLYALIFTRKLGKKMLILTKFVLWPSGGQLHFDSRGRAMSGCVRVVGGVVVTLVLFVPIVVSSTICLVTGYYITMGLILPKLLWVIFTKLDRLNDRKIGEKVLSCGKPGEVANLRREVLDCEVPYLLLLPFSALALAENWAKGRLGWLHGHWQASAISLLGTIPLMYMIGVCTEVLSGRFGFIFGSLFNAIFTALVELILFGFAMGKGMARGVQGAVLGGFLLHALLFPGLAVLTAGIMRRDVKINRTAQSVNGTFVLLIVVALFTPSLFYQLQGDASLTCSNCSGVEGNMSCSSCAWRHPDVVGDPLFKSAGRPLMYVIACVMPLLYAAGMIFSLRTHAHIYHEGEENESHNPEHENPLPTWGVFLVLAVCVGIFSIVAEALTDNIKEAIANAHLSEKFAGLFFLTVVPAIAEYVNVVRFAREDMLQLALEVGNQGALVVSLIQMPALVALGAIFDKVKKTSGTFTLIFDGIDIGLVVLAVLLRGSMLGEKIVHWFTGFAFLIVFAFICVVYFFDKNS